MKRRIFSLFAFLLVGCGQEAPQLMEAVSPAIASEEALTAVEGQVQPSSVEDILMFGIDEMRNSGYPVDGIGASLFDLKTGEYAGYQDETGIYPASTVKLYWAIAAIKVNGLKGIEDLVQKAIHDSDNNSASKLVDILSDSEDCAVVVKDRDEALKPFGEGLKGTRKTYPIYDEGLESPSGCDLNLQRNYLTAKNLSSMLVSLAMNPEALGLSQQERIFLMDSMHQTPPTENKEKWSATKGFFGEWLPDDSTIHTKIGWTQTLGRSEGAIIVRHGKGSYVLVLLTGEELFSKDEMAFPQFSATIYQLMEKRFEGQNET